MNILTCSFIIVFMIPLGIEFKGFINLASIGIYSSDLDPGISSSMTVEKHSEALFENFSSLFFRAVLVPIVSN